MIVLNMSNHDSQHTERPRTSLFGVFDGHGGKEVAKFASAHLPRALASTPAYPKGDMPTALSQAFLEIDNLLIMDEHKDELIALKGNDEEGSPGGGGGGRSGSDGGGSGGGGCGCGGRR